MIALGSRSEAVGISRLAADWPSWLRAPRLRTMREFAEQEVIIPDGPLRGRRFRCSTQPWTRLWFDEIDSGRWQRFAATGPSQSGKTLCCYVIPTMYHLFEIGETVVCGVPKMEMAHDKWSQDFEPAIRASRYAELMPIRGKGSRGGDFDSITFRNGATLKFMTGGGDDKSRAGFTSRVVVITEVDGLDRSSDLSREADPITQMEARTRAYGSRKRVYLECTVSTFEGRIWQEFQAGTASQIAMPCPHCGEHVTPERKEFIGWDGASSAIAAESMGKLYCPVCATGWSEEQRVAANHAAVIRHRGQDIVDGRATGPLPETRTLGFRWTAANNLFVTQAELSSEEWIASQEIDQDNAQKARNQFVWTIPADSDVSMVTRLDAKAIVNRQSEFPRGMMPPGIRAISVGVDVGKWYLHWTAKAWDTERRGLTIDYGIQDVHSGSEGEEVAIVQALRALADMLRGGFGEQRRGPDCVLVDSGNWTKTVYAACSELGPPFYPSKGFGATAYGGGRYHQSGAAHVLQRGNGWHVIRTDEGVELVEFDADAWKSRVHSRLECEPNKPGSLMLFQTQPREHLTYAKHLLAEQKTEEFVVGKGLIEKWVKVNRNNHYLDSETLANIAGDAVGIEVVKVENHEPKRTSRVTATVSARPDGRGWWE